VGCLPIALWGVCRAFRRFFADDLIVPVIATGIVFNLAAYIISVTPVTWYDTREIAAVLPFGAVLAGRLLARTLARAWLRRVLAGVLACYAVALGYSAVQLSAAETEQPVVGWLEAHHLSTGLGTYAEANLITLDSGGRVAIRTVTWWLPRAVPRAYESEASWYEPPAELRQLRDQRRRPETRRDGVNIPPAISSRSPDPRHTPTITEPSPYGPGTVISSPTWAGPRHHCPAMSADLAASFAGMAFRHSVHWRND
jgi:hypothetical protein